MCTRSKSVIRDDAFRRVRPAMAEGLLITPVIANPAAAQQASVESARDLLAKGQVTEAEAVLREVVAADPRNSDALILLGTT